eukprot:10485844-Alexandrium_andersonii.AAC.1
MSLADCRSPARGRGCRRPSLPPWSVGLRPTSFSQGRHTRLRPPRPRMTWRSRFTPRISRGGTASSPICSNWPHSPCRRPFTFLVRMSARWRPRPRFMRHS